MVQVVDESAIELHQATEILFPMLDYNHWKYAEESSWSKEEHKAMAAVLVEHCRLRQNPMMMETMKMMMTMMNYYDWLITSSESNRCRCEWQLI